MKKNILYSKPLTVHFNDIPQDFKKICSEADVSYRYERANFFFRSALVPQIVVAICIIKNLNFYDDNIVITGRYGLLFSLLKNLIPIKINLILTDVEFRKIPSRFKDIFFLNFIKRFILNNCCKIGVFCEYESILYSNFFGVNREKFFFLPYHTVLAWKSHESNETGSYIFSGGFHDRDYRTLFKAVAGLDVILKIAAPRSYFSAEDIPSNVEILGVVSKSNYLELILNSKFVVLSLSSDCLRFPGVISYVYAMSLAKCVIVNDLRGARSYINNGKNGLLCKPNSPEALRKLIQFCLLRSDKVEEMAKNARSTIVNELSIDHYFERLRAIIRKV